MDQCGRPVCAVDDCERPRRKREWCTMHYARWRSNGDPNVVQKVRSTGLKCSIAGCGRPVDSRGWCTMHYSRWQKRGHTGLNGKPPVDPTCKHCGNLRVLNNKREFYCRSCKKQQNADHHRLTYADPNGREDRLARNRCWRTAHRQELRERRRQAYRENPMRYIAYNEVRRARKMHAICDHGAKCVNAEYLTAIRSGICAYCGAPGEQADHVVPLARGGKHCRQNIVSACAPCNYSKNALLPSEWQARNQKRERTA